MGLFGKGRHSQRVLAEGSEAPSCVEGADVGASGGRPERHRVHHSYIWLGGIRVILVVLFSVAISLGSSLVPLFIDGTMGSQDDAHMIFVIFGLCALGVLLLVVAIVAYQVISYKHLWYELAESEFSLFSGILSKKRVHIPYQRIQSVDQRASLLQRVFGVCTVSIDTAGGSSNKATVVPYLAKQDAEVLRRELFARKSYALAVESGAVGAFAVDAFALQGASGNVLDAPAGLWEEIGGVFAGQAVDTGAVSFEYGLTNKELILTGLSNNTAFAIALVGVLGVIVQVIEGVLSVAPGATTALDHLIAQGSAWAIGAAVTAGIALALGAAVLVWALSAVATCISYGGFKARRRGSRIEVEHGLLQHRFRGVDVDRVQSITVRQSLIRRALGCCEISLGKVEAVDGEDGAQQGLGDQGLIIHPFVRLDRVSEILGGLIPECADVPYEALPLPRVALRRAIVRRCVLQGFGFWLALLTAIVHISVAVAAGLSTDADLLSMARYVNSFAVVAYVFAVLLLVIDAIGAVLWFRESSFAYNGGFMQLTVGGLSRETTSIPRGKIQFGYTRANPFQRRAGTCSVCVRTAAGVGGSTMRLIDASELDAVAWLEWLKPRANRAGSER